MRYILYSKLCLTFFIKIVIQLFLLVILINLNITSFAAISDNESNLFISPDDESEKSQIFYPYFTQSVHFKWIKEGDIGDFQGLLVPELGTIIKTDPQSDICLYLDFSVSAQIYDIYNIKFAPVNLNVNKAYLNYKPDFSNKHMPDNIKFEIYSDNQIIVYDDSLNLGLEGAWLLSEKVKLYAEFLLYDLFSCQNNKFSNNKYGLNIGAQWFDLFNREGNKHTNFKIEYNGADNCLLLQINQQINDSLSLEVAYKHNCHISTSINYNISKNWQLELTGFFCNSHNNDFEPGQNAREFSLLTLLSYRF